MKSVPRHLLHLTFVLSLVAVATTAGCSKPARYGESPNNLEPPPEPTIDPYVKNCQTHLEFSSEQSSMFTIRSAEHDQDTEEGHRVVLDYDVAAEHGEPTRARFECHYLAWRVERKNDPYIVNLTPKAHYLEVQGITKNGVALDQMSVVKIRIKAHRALIDRATRSDPSR